MPSISKPQRFNIENRKYNESPIPSVIEPILSNLSFIWAWGAPNPNPFC